MAGDIQGLVADSSFQGLSPEDKRSVLAGVTGDKSFNDLGDSDTMQFVAHVTDRAKLTRPDLFAPPGVPRPQVPMSQSALGPIQSGDPSQLPFGGMHGGSYDIAFRDPRGQISPETLKAEAVGGVAGAAASPFAAPLASRLPQVAKAAAKAVPYVAASEGINLLRQKMGAAGKFIPSGAEMLPYFMMGGGSKGQAASESAAEAGAAEGRVPVGKFAKETANPNPYKFKGAPDSMDIVQSTNVGKVGYEPDSRTMTVEYRNGLVYSYHGVPQEIYNGAKDSESIGSYISRNVKGRYETVRRGSVLVNKK